MTTEPGRPKGGRPAGGKNSARLAVAQALLTDGATPLEIMVAHMRDQYSRATKASGAARQAHLAAAAAAAKDAAPYMHPRLNAIDHSHSGAMNWRDVFAQVEAIGEADLARAKAQAAAKR